MTDGVPYGARLTALAERHGDATALIFSADDGTEAQYSWRQFDTRANQVARLLAARGVEEGDTVVVSLGNEPAHLFATFGAWGRSRLRGSGRDLRPTGEYVRTRVLLLMTAAAWPLP